MRGGEGGGGGVSTPTRAQICMTGSRWTPRLGERLEGDAEHEAHEVPALHLRQAVPGAGGGGGGWSGEGWSGGWSGGVVGCWGWVGVGGGGLGWGFGVGVYGAWGWCHSPDASDPRQHGQKKPSGREQSTTPASGRNAIFSLPQSDGVANPRLTYQGPGNAKRPVGGNAKPKLKRSQKNIRKDHPES